MTVVSEVRSQEHSKDYKAYFKEASERRRDEELARRAKRQSQKAKNEGEWQLALKEERVEIIPPPDPWAPSSVAFVKDEVYWQRFHELMERPGSAEVYAHQGAMAKSKAMAELRDSGFHNQPRRVAAGSQLQNTRRSPVNDNRKPAVLPVVCASSLAGKTVPPREFFVPHLIPKGKVTLLSGDGGTGKSLLALMLGASSALGDRWLDMPAYEGSVLVLSAEDDLDEVHRRLASIVGEYGLAALDRLHIAPLVGVDPILAAPDRATGRMAETELFQDLKRKLNKLKPELLILDTLADLFGGDEVKREQARGFVAMLNRLTAEFGTTIVLLSHPSQSGMESGRGTSGSTAWSNSVRSRLYLKHHESDPDMRVLELMKTNSNRPGMKFLLRWQNGYFERVDERQQRADDLGEAKREFMRLLEEFVRQGRPPSPNRSASYAPKLFAEYPGVRVTKPKFVAAMNELLRDRKIEIETDGPPSRRTSRLAMAGLQPSEDEAANDQQVDEDEPPSAERY